MTSANDKRTYHLRELDGTRIVTPVAGKRINMFKKRHEDESDLEGVDDGDNWIGANGDLEKK